MFSKLKLAVFCFAFGLGGCGLRIGEEALPNKAIIVGGGGFSCLRKLGSEIESFLGARLSDGEISQIFGCLRFSLTSFQEHSRGILSDSFSPKEIRDFLEAYFLKDRKIPDQLLNDFMVIKQVMLGGPVDRITFKDIRRAVDTLGFLERMALKLNPYMKIYNFNLGMFKTQSADATVSPIALAASTLAEVANEFGERLKGANNPYPLSHLESFVEGFRQFTGWEQIFSASLPAKNWVQFMAAFKSLVAGDRSDHVRPQDWPALLSTAATCYGLTLKLHYAKSQVSFLYGQGLSEVAGAGSDVIGLLESAVDHQLNRFISYDQLDQMIDGLAAVRWLPEVPAAAGLPDRPFRVEGLKKFIRPVFDRMFGDESVPWMKRQSGGITVSVVQRIKADFSRWAEIQFYLASTMKPESRNSQWSGPWSSKLSPLSLASGLFGKRPWVGSSGDAILAVREIQQNLRPLFRPGSDRVFLTEEAYLDHFGVTHGFSNLSAMNLARAAVAIVMRGYSSYKGSDGAFDTGMSEEELQAFYLDFRDFGLDLQLVDPRNNKVGHRSFLEANLFTYSANGLHAPSAKLPRQSLVTFFEMMELASFVYSGGGLGRLLYSDLMESEEGVCAHESLGAPTSVHGYDSIDRNCFRAKFLDIALPYLGTMPRMKEQLGRLNAKERQAAAADLMTAAYSTRWSDPKYIDWHELTTIAMILNYSEAIMTRYNRNLNLTLDTDEVWTAYETFRGYVGRIATQKCSEYVGKWNQTPLSSRARMQEFVTQTFGWNDLKENFKNWIENYGCENIPEPVLAAVYAHILSTGRIPTSIWEVNLFPRWPIVGVEFSVDRRKLIRLFGTLIQAISINNSVN